MKMKEKNQYTKFLRHIFCLAAISIIAAVTVSCSKDDIPVSDDPVPDNPAPVVETRPQRLVRLTDCTSWTLAEFSELMQTLYRDGLSEIFFDYNAPEQFEYALDAMSIAHFADNAPKLAAKFLKEGSMGYHFERQNFLYSTVTAAGDSAVLSGSVIYPISNSGKPHTLDGWTVYSDFATTNNEVRLSAYPEMSYFRAAFNQAVAFSDLQGFGATNMIPNDATTTQLLPCYFDYLSRARQTVDATIAASQVLDMKGLTMAQDQFVENMGVSLGAPAALGVLKYIETEECCQGWVRDSLMRGIRTFAAGGPINMWDVFTDFLKADVSMEYYYFPMMIATSVFASFPDRLRNYEISDFFNPRMRIPVPTTLGETIGIIEAVASAHFDNFSSYAADEIEFYFGSKMKRMMESSMFNEDGMPNLEDPKMAILKMALESYSISDGWSPHSPVLLAHSPQDDVTEFERVTDALKQFRSVNDDVSFLPLPGNHLISSFLCHLYMLYNPHPSLYVDRWASLFGLDL